ncbi:hypothetical protein BV96_04678 [Sphingomonas paucimobilis]|nr:hypothetical protein BV96_04678 [Sphingomonas paucimobilis]
MLHNPDDPERRRLKNAKRMLWMVSIGILGLLAVVAVTALQAPDDGGGVPRGSSPIALP